MATIPRSTYRVQFNAGFTFADARAIVPYLAQLGISHLYASPFLKARAGSTHGYDIADHTQLNPELGDQTAFDDLAETLHEHGMGLIADFVPNHMGVAEPENTMWQDVLENGPASPFAAFFDIDWLTESGSGQRQVVLPVLGDQYGVILENGELQLHYADGRFQLHYYDNRFPIGPATATRLLQIAIDHARRTVGADDPGLVELESITTALHRLPGRDELDEERVRERLREKEVAARRLDVAYLRWPRIQEAVDAAVAHLNGTPGQPASFDALDGLLRDQAYRLCDWRVATEEINYRRFFDVKELAGLRMEHPAAFEHAHSLILELVSSGAVDGLRIDHPDGLFDPKGYFDRLQEAAAAQLGLEWSRAPGADLPLYVVAEKILEHGETLPTDWAVHGTTGYDFLNVLNNLFLDRRAEARLSAAYRRVTGWSQEPADLIYACKRLIMESSLASERNVLGLQLYRLAQANRRTRDFTRGNLTRAIEEVVACFPTYRSYVTGRARPGDRAMIEAALAEAQRRNPAIEPSVYAFLRSVLLLEVETDDPRLQGDVRRWVGKFQQYTGPVMAKGVEDTAFYRFNRLVSINEVGSDLASFGAPVGAFHRYQRQAARRWPHTMTTTSTHDTKRSADVRARLDVLTELPGAWDNAVARWRTLTRQVPARRGRRRPPPEIDPNDEYLLYQSLVGTLEVGEGRRQKAEGRSGDGSPGVASEVEQAEALGPKRAEGASGDWPSYVARISEYMIKAVREGKRTSSWTSPNEGYEAGLRTFIERVLRPDSNPFLDDLRAFTEPVAWFGSLNSLSQVLLKYSAPGVPDLYQGEELWDLSLVDPDNRRPVDYALRRDLLEGAVSEPATGSQAGPPSFATVLAQCAPGGVPNGQWWSGLPKLALTHALLQWRRQCPDLATHGDYLPLTVSGPRKNHVVAFARVHGDQAAIIVAGRFFRSLTNGETRLPSAADWSGTTLVVPPTLESPSRWHDALDGRAVSLDGWNLESLCAARPWALLVR